MLGCYLKTDQSRIESIKLRAMEKVNDELKLNINIGVSVDWGNTYAQCH